MAPRKKTTKRKVVRRKVSSGAPVGVKIISVIAFIKAGILLIVGIALFLGGLIGTAVLSGVGIEKLIELTGGNNDPITGIVASAIVGSLIVSGIIVIVLSVLAYYVGRGLWDGRNWARIVVIVLSVITFISAIGSLDIFSIIVGGVIGGYMWFGNDVKRYFKN